MKRQLPGLSEAIEEPRTSLPDGIYLVRVDGAQYRWHAQKPFYLLRLSIVEPEAFTGRSIASRLYCTAKAMWKLGWFLRDFLYDPELLGQSEVEERALRGLVGVVKISHTVINGIRLVSLDGFAPAIQWPELSSSSDVSSLAKSKTSRKSGSQQKGSMPQKVSP